MSFALFTDSSANLPQHVLEQCGIQVVSLTYRVGDREYPCYAPNEPFDSETFYASMKDPSFTPRTSLVNGETFRAAFAPVLEGGQDILYIGMSSGISGTLQSAAIAREALMKEYPRRTVRIVDTLGASLGEGLMVCHGAALRESGAELEDAAQAIEALVPSMCQRFLVDDLMYLKRGGRVSGAAAVIGTLINIKPIMKGVSGKIELDCKVMGRQKALRTLADYFAAHAIQPETQTVGIAHAASQRDALSLRDMILERRKVKEFLIVPYEPGTGAHVGPGTVALFFLGQDAGNEANPLLASVKKRIESIDTTKLRSAIRDRFRKHVEPRE